MNILLTLRERLRDALLGLTADPTLFADMVRVASIAGSDYQANCAMPLAKLLDRKAPEVAAELARRLHDAPGPIETVEVAGPGFLNLRLCTDWLAEQLQRMASDDRLGVALTTTPRTFVIDFSSPNVAKPLHVGHLRSTIIGDAIARLLRFLGHRVITDNHLGDWGTQFGMLLYGYKHFLDAAALQRDPVGEMLRLYRLVRELTKGDEDEDGQTVLDPEARRHLDACRQEVVRLHQGDPETLALWQQFQPWCLGAIQPIYDRLDVHFDHTLGESFYNALLPDVVADLLAKGVAQESQGAVVIAAQKRGMHWITVPPDTPGAAISIVRKGNGAYTYTATDLATIRYRMTTFQPDALLYVVDFRQSQHFAVLFAASRDWGYHPDLEHVSFGAMLGPNRKPIKTREGKVIELTELLDEAVQRGAARYEQITAERLARGEEVPTLTAEERSQVAEVVGLGAVKYADLSQNRTSDYVFHWDKMLTLDGNTAPYMQYAFVRCRGIFRKGDIDPASLRAHPPRPKLDHPAERALALQLLRFEETLVEAASSYSPHLLTGYLWDLAKAYNRFFEECPVLKAEPADLRLGRLLLCDLTARRIQQALHLLGIRTIERM